MPTKPNPLKVIINGQQYDYLAFYYPGQNTDWDNVYGVPYFGNFWEKDPFTVQLKGPISGIFQTAEAAYQASKWWSNDIIRKEFEACLTGDDAFRLKKKYDGIGHGNKGYKIPHDPTYGGYFSGEDAMYAILLQKFSDNHPALKAKLGATGNAYLLEHSAVLSKPDFVWSDGNNGKGTNHLGLSLMKVREHYFPGQGNPLESEDSTLVIPSCTTALRTEMKKLGLSADDKDPMVI